jgi:dTDP-4-amino-4,6-dideoxygalactose transaminase
MGERLAIDGGRPVRETKLHAGFHGSAEIGDAEIRAVRDVLENKRLFRFLDGHSYAADLEDFYRQRIGRGYALAVNGGTSALICGMFGLNLGPGDEVIIPAHTYVATAASVIAAGAVPVLCEVDTSLNMDPTDLERQITPYTKAIVPVHMRGIPARMDEIVAVAQHHSIPIMEDVAQSNGGTYKGRPLGSFGKVACFSLQQYKIITSGEGGVMLTDDEEIYDRGRLQHDCAARFWEGVGSKSYEFVVSGENYRLSELSAALAVAQYDRLDPLLEHLRSVKDRMVAGIQDVNGITLQDVPDPEGDCGITLTFFLEEASLAKRFAEALSAENIGCGTVYNKVIPDRHIYAYWPFMVSGLAEPRRAPWHSPFYEGDIRSYEADQCPQTLDLLGRSVMIFIDQSFGMAEADQVVEGVRKVAGALL